jgi:cystathionine gamma-synthase
LTLLQLIAKLLATTKSEGQSCIPFSSPESATECVKFATSPARQENAVSPDQISIRIFDVPGVVKLYVVFLPAERHKVAWPFWINAGVGVSSRLAEDCVKADGWKEVKVDEGVLEVVEVEAQSVLRGRIAGLIERV